MKTRLVFFVIYLYSAGSSLSQEFFCDYLSSKFVDLSKSTDAYGLTLYDSISSTIMFSTGEIRRVVNVEENNISIQLFPFNPFTEKEEFMIEVSVECHENEYCLKIDSIMHPASYFKELDIVEISEVNADSMGYYYVYKLLLTKDEQWIWKIQKAIKSLSADGSFFLLLDFLRDLHLIASKNYEALFIGDALHSAKYCAKAGKK